MRIQLEESKYIPQRATHTSAITVFDDRAARRQHKCQQPPRSHGHGGCIAELSMPTAVKQHTHTAGQHKLRASHIIIMLPVKP
jgi:hypothetical protein